jgi:hypothetical protein
MSTRQVVLIVVLSAFIGSFLVGCGQEGTKVTPDQTAKIKKKKEEKG